jgi:hypothetical protein
MDTNSFSFEIGRNAIASGRLNIALIHYLGALRTVDENERKSMETEFTALLQEYVLQQCRQKSMDKLHLKQHLNEIFTLAIELYPSSSHVYNICGELAFANGLFDR